MAIWGLVGTTRGGVIAIGGNWIMQRGEQDERARRERREVAARARDERKVAYLRLLAAARQLRYRARPVARMDAEEINSLKSELSTLHYEIELIALADIVLLSNAVRREVLNHIDLAIAESSAAGPDGKQSRGLEMKRKAARAAVEVFTAQARGDLGVSMTDIDPGKVQLPTK